MTELFREFFWLIFPILGMGIAFAVIFGEFGRQKRALDVLRVYAEKGTEPPPSVLAVLSRASSDRKKNPMANFVFFGVLALGSGAIAIGMVQPGSGWPPQLWPFVLGLAMAAFVMVALAVSNLVQAKSRTSGTNGA